MVIGVLVILSSTPVASSDSNFERCYGPMNYYHTMGQAVIQMENLPASVQPGGRLEDGSVSGQVVGKLGIIFLCQVRLLASWRIILLQVRLWASWRIILLQVRLWDNSVWSPCVKLGCGAAEGIFLSQVSLRNSFCTRSFCRTTSRGSPHWYFIWIRRLSSQV